jgi:hypothetical protein
MLQTTGKPLLEKPNKNIDVDLTLAFRAWYFAAAW